MKKLILSLLTLISVSAQAQLEVNTESSEKFLTLKITNNEICNEDVKVRMLNFNNDDIAFSSAVIRGPKAINYKKHHLKRNNVLKFNLANDQIVSLAMLQYKGVIEAEIELSACDESVVLRTDHNYIVIVNRSSL